MNRAKETAADTGKRAGAVNDTAARVDSGFAGLVVGDHIWILLNETFWIEAKNGPGTTEVEERRRIYMRSLGT